MNADAARYVLLAQLSNIETAKQQNRLFEALKSGSDAVKEMQKEVKRFPLQSHQILLLRPVDHSSLVTLICSSAFFRGNNTHEEQ